MKNRNFLNNHSINTLINLANIESGLLDNNFVAAPEDLNKFVDIKLGIPSLIPADEKIVDFQLKDVFEIEKNTLLSIVYSHQDEDYVGFKHSFRKFKFLSKNGLNSSGKFGCKEALSLTFFFAFTITTASIFSSTIDVKLGRLLANNKFEATTNNE